MTKISKKITGAGLLAAMGLSALSPVQQGAFALSVAGAAMWAAPAMAQTGIPGVGVVVKKKPGNAPIIVPSDASGEVRISGLEPGEYEVAPLRLTAAAPVRNTSMTVGKEGQLAIAVKAEAPKGDVGKGRATAAAGDIKIEPIPDLKGGSVIVALLPAVALNTANADQIARATGTSMQSAVHIVAQREKGGRYASIEDFARRNCPTMAIEMSKGGIKVADLTVMMPAQSGKPVVAGFQCGPRGGQQFSLYGKKHNYVGHVTLLR